MVSDGVSVGVCVGVGVCAGVAVGLGDGVGCMFGFCEVWLYAYAPIEAAIIAIRAIVKILPVVFIVITFECSFPLCIFKHIVSFLHHNNRHLKNSQKTCPFLKITLGERNLTLDSCFPPSTHEE